jgi:ribonuclease R
MLPRKLSENLCSLKPNEDRLAFVFKIYIDEKHLRIKRFELFEAIINSKKRYTYEMVDYLFANPPFAKEDKNIFSFLVPLSKLTQKIRAKRLQKGFDFSNAQIRLELDKNLNLISTYKEEQTLSHKIIEECMLLANKSAATFFDNGIFRVHLPPDFKSLNNLKKELQEIGIEFNFYDDIHESIKDVQLQAEKLNIKEQVDMLIIRSLKRAEYSYNNSSHFGLGFERYTHFTSPIRRYSDLILHRFLKTIIFYSKKETAYLKSILPFICEDITKLEEEATKVEWDYEDRVYARWAEKNINNIYEGILVDLHPNKDYIIKLDDTIKGARIFAKRTHQEFHLFERVKVKIISSDIITTRIKGEIQNFKD